MYISNTNIQVLIHGSVVRITPGQMVTGVSQEEIDVLEKQGFVRKLADKETLSSPEVLSQSDQTEGQPEVRVQKETKKKEKGESEKVVSPEENTADLI